MKDSKYKWILYLIPIVMFCTLWVQGYWNYKNYLLNKQNFVNQVQFCFDNALDAYYADYAKSNSKILRKSSDTLRFKNSNLTFINDSTLKNIHTVLKRRLMKNITSLYLSINNDTINFSKLNPILSEELKRKDFDFSYSLRHFVNDSLINSFNGDQVFDNYFKTNAKSTFLRNNERLELTYPNAIKHIIMKGLTGILLSLILMLTIVLSLLYLFKTIKHQKQLAEIKNDLISNITHEFKTPISTINVAIEAIKNFNNPDDIEKTHNYLDISNDQLSKLNVMVEKLLETATLDGNNLDLKKELINVSELLNSLIEKHKLQTKSKITYISTDNTINAFADPFHFENAVNNILDNAVKYGGQNIKVKLSQNKSNITISISDDGTSLNNLHKEKIFEKFYRVPKGNTHDVKGFGIGLYYSKKVIEKHGGTVELQLTKLLATFIIHLPSE